MTGTASPDKAPLVVNGWTIYAHPIFLNQLESLIEEVKARKERDPVDWSRKNCAKRLAAIFKLVSENIPADPGAPTFRQGDALGEQRKHWFRAKFFQQYRLFYRFDSIARVIVLAWVNDERNLRAYGRKTDAYATFRCMLNNGNPPDSFDVLMQEAVAAALRFEDALKTGPDYLR